LVEKKLEPPNIGFVQFWISGSESELEFYFHDANHSTGEISFETFENEFGEKKANFSSRV
jgi:hypothetical protein